MLKVGDMVQIKTFPKECYPIYWSPERISFNGKSATIKQLIENRYILNEFDFYWKYEDFEESNVFKQLDDKLFKI